MADKLLDKFADDTISGLKRFFAHRINNGEDPTTCMQMFLNFLESNKDKNPQLFKKIASRIDSSFFASVVKVNQIASPDDLITAYDNLVNRLLEINPQMPYKADYERQRASIEKNKRQIKEKLRKEKEEKKRIVDNEYRKLLSERKKEYKSGNNLRIGVAVCFILFVVLLPVILLHVPGSDDDTRMMFVVVGMAVGAIWGALISRRMKDVGVFVGAIGGFVLGTAVGTISGIICIDLLLPPYFFVVCWPVLGIVLAIIYRSKVAAIRLSLEERSAYDTSLANIEQHFSDKEKNEIAQSTVRILATDDTTLDLD